jgi:hypothetical protein
MRTRLIVLAILGTVLGLAPATARSDAVYHSEHLALTPVGDAPLRSGFVENIHMNGPRLYAHENYVLNGATPGTDYSVTLLVHPLAPDCSGTPVLVPTATFTTNAAGNGHGSVVFDVATTTATGLRGATHGISWQVTGTNGDVYVTACSVVTLD